MNTKEIWKDIPGYEGLYQVSTYGRVKSLKRTKKNIKDKLIRPVNERILKQGNSTQGYKMVTLSKDAIKKTKLVHILIGLAFIPNPKGKTQINHINGKKYDNNINNLEWCTPKENTDHAIKSDLRNNVGESNSFSKLTLKEVVEIKNILQTTDLLHREIADIYNVSRGTITSINNNRNWDHV